MWIALGALAGWTAVAMAALAAHRLAERLRSDRPQTDPHDGATVLGAEDIE
jgi:uncharacterized membrane protein YgdD (TMEM256/DUF423 family)